MQGHAAASHEMTRTKIEEVAIGPYTLFAGQAKIREVLDRLDRVNAMKRTVGSKILPWGDDYPRIAAGAAAHVGRLRFTHRYARYFRARVALGEPPDVAAPAASNLKNALRAVGTGLFNVPVVLSLLSCVERVVGHRVAPAARRI